MTMDYLAAFSTLLLLEVILGVDNVIFISILVERLPKTIQAKVRNIGIGLAVVCRIGLVFSVSWLMTLTEPVLVALGKQWSGKDLILMLGGVFLVVKSLHELVIWLRGKENPQGSSSKSNLTLVVLQIIAVDVVFSFDSVITAVALVHKLEIIVAAIVISALLMLALANKIQIAITSHPGLKLLALLFLILLGAMLMTEGVGYKIDKSYLYVVLAFGLTLEAMHIILRRQLEKQVNAGAGVAR